MELTPTRLAAPLVDPEDAPADGPWPPETMAGATLRFLAHQLDDNAANAAGQIADYVDQVAHLVRHMDIHAAYWYGGYAKMTTEQRALYRALAGWDPPGPPVIHQPHGSRTPIIEDPQA